MARVMRVRVSPTAPHLGLGYRQVRLRQRILNPPLVGSNPTTPARQILGKRFPSNAEGFFLSKSLKIPSLGEPKSNKNSLDFVSQNLSFLAY